MCCAAIRSRASLRDATEMPSRSTRQPTPATGVIAAPLEPCLRQTQLGSRVFLKVLGEQQLTKDSRFLVPKCCSWCSALVCPWLLFAHSSPPKIASLGWKARISPSYRYSAAPHSNLRLSSNFPHLEHWEPRCSCPREISRPCTEVEFAFCDLATMAVHPTRPFPLSLRGLDTTRGPGLGIGFRLQPTRVALERGTRDSGGNWGGGNPTEQSPGITP